MPVTQHARRLEADDSQAATTPSAAHEDELSPAKALRDTSTADGGQRIGDSGPVANPIVSFPGPEPGPETEDDTAPPRPTDV